MAVTRVVFNVGAEEFGPAEHFYRDLLGMEVVMDLGWIMTFAGEGATAPQVSVAREGGSGTPVPDMSVEVSDFDAVLQRCRGAGLPIEYGPVDEPWGVTRFYIRDPHGRLVNVLMHR
jgi:catechol 2,3-dioxygenase-like lactoylglutathione lyase family enzyme